LPLTTHECYKLTPMLRKKFTTPQPVHILIDTIIIVASLYASLALRLSGEDPGTHFQTLNNFVVLFAIIQLTTMYFYGIYSAIWRYASVFDFTRLLRAVFISSLIFLSVSYLMPDFGRLPRSIFFIDFFIAMAGLSGVRILSRMYHEKKGRRFDATDNARKVLIYGAGENGRSLASRLNNDPNIRQTVVGYIDDDPVKAKRVIGGIPVLGGLEDLSKIITAYSIDDVMVSISHAPGQLIRNILEKSREHNIVPQIFNHFNDRVTGQQNILRQISLKDLLARNSSNIDHSSLKNIIHNKTVLVTGAGGSIGSEIARQINSYSPKKLLILDHSEFNLYNIDKELRLNSSAQNTIVPILMDIKDRNSLENVLSDHKPEVIYHAAAYKHVHLVELNPFASILNNVLGTLNLLEISKKLNVSIFLNVSTDKAVNPVGIMGSTKRVCERLTSYFGTVTGRQYSSVRFGNVLGSSGSLIPLLQKQLQNNEPLTITHPDMKRYFMLIPEAVSLVLMSSIIAKSRDINLLDMGEQIKILDLAKNLIMLNGKREAEVEIIFTGLRPGEKMYEELYISGKEIQTNHPDILTIPKGDNAEASESQLLSQVLAMIEFSKQNDARALGLLEELAGQQRQTVNLNNNQHVQK
jgi:FlaA1/EpsC-like NDP-sugar epimerase